MISPTTNASAPWSARWQPLARAAGIDADEPLLLALSGGADSVFLLHVLAEAYPAPRVLAVHVDHGLRGPESTGDAQFCANLCRALGVRFVRRELDLVGASGSLEARARRARYRALLEEAATSGHRTILTGHHADDALETLLWRWARGTTAAGLRGPGLELRPSRVADAVAGREPESADGPRIVRPLLPLRREEVRRLLLDRGLRWREDSSNDDPAFTRNRLRNGFLPFVERIAGAEGVENLRAFGRAVDELEHVLAGATAHLAWRPGGYAAASRGPRAYGLGGVLARADLMRLASPLRRRALWRLLTEGTGRAPSRALLATLLADLGSGRCTRHVLPGEWILLLRSSELHLLPPDDLRAFSEESAAPRREDALLPFPEPTAPRRARRAGPRASSAVELEVPGILSLADGRRIAAERVRLDSRVVAPRGGLEVELDAAELPSRLVVRWPREGDRFHALGAPGSKPLSRFLADRGIPREERGTIPVVAADREILWVAGIELGERHRVRTTTVERLRLSLHHRTGWTV